MNSIFLRLYCLIVVTIIVVGISLDAVWRHYDSSLTDESIIREQLQLVSLQIDSLPSIYHQQQIGRVNLITSGEFLVLTKNHPLYLSLIETLVVGDVLFTKNGNSLVGFSRLNNHPSILKYSLNSQQQSPYLNLIFIILFYGIIALTVFFWIWPLSKDLNRLEKAVGGFDQQQWQSKIELPATSSVNHLAKAYNALLDRIRLLVDTQQAMSHSISHELRTPLARIRFSLQMADETDNIMTIKQQLESMSDDVVEMNQLINELLNFSALEKTSTTAKLERGDINLLIGNLLERLERNFPKKRFLFQTSDQGHNVLCDSYLMERALQNLLVNAGKFSDKEIIIAFIENSEHYEISVEDDGPGVETNMNESIFDSFVQLDSEKKQNGFGLGLAIVKRIMSLHSGQASVEGSSQGGARFILRWPKITVIQH